MYSNYSLGNENLCRLCFKTLTARQSHKNMFISKEFLWKFKELTRFELISRPELPSMTCYDCYQQFEYIYKCRNEMIEKQIEMGCLNIFVDNEQCQIDGEVDPTENHEISSSISTELKVDSMLERTEAEKQQTPVSCLNENLDDYTAFDNFSDLSDENISDLNEINIPDFQTSEDEKKIPPRNRLRKVVESKKTNNSLNSKLRCNLCLIQFKQSKELNDHLKAKHKTDQLKFICDYCGRCVKKSSIINHIKVFHLKHLFDVFCESCGEAFASNAILARHRWNVHDGLEYHCDICGFTFKSHIDIRRHMRYQHIKSKFCEICGIYFTKRKFYCHNYKNIHSYKYTCPVKDCDRVFNSEAHFDVHKRMSHRLGGDEQQLFECPLCKKLFPSIQKVKRHISRIHKTEKIHCPIPGCSYTANRRDYFKIHFKTRIHENLSEQELDVYREMIRQVPGNFN